MPLINFEISDTNGFNSLIYLIVEQTDIFDIDEKTGDFFVKPETKVPWVPGTDNVHEFTIAARDLDGNNGKY